jgi:hypothetical protein
MSIADHPIADRPIADRPITPIPYFFGPIVR